MGGGRKGAVGGVGRRVGEGGAGQGVLGILKLEERVGVVLPSELVSEAPGNVIIGVTGYFPLKHTVLIMFYYQFQL